MSVSKVWDLLLDRNYFTLEELNLVTDINGLSINTFDDMCFSRFGVDTAELLELDEE